MSNTQKDFNALQPEEKLKVIKRNTTREAAVISAILLGSAIATNYNLTFLVALGVQAGMHVRSILRMSTVDKFDSFETGKEYEIVNKTLGVGMFIGSIGFLMEFYSKSHSLPANTLLLLGALGFGIAAYKAVLSPVVYNLKGPKND